MIDIVKRHGKCLSQLRYSSQIWNIWIMDRMYKYVTRSWMLAIILKYLFWNVYKPILMVMACSQTVMYCRSKQYTKSLLSYLSNIFHSTRMERCWIFRIARAGSLSVCYSGWNLQNVWYIIFWVILYIDDSFSCANVLCQHPCVLVRIYFNKMKCKFGVGPVYFFNGWLEKIAHHSISSAMKHWLQSMYLGERGWCDI